MASTLNASSSGAGGLVSTADASGILQLQTAGTTAVTVDASQNVGIGTSSPSFPSGSGLAIYNSSVPRLKFSNSTTGDASTDGTNLLVSGSDFYIQQREAASVIIATNGADRATIDSAGNLGLGVAPSAWYTGGKALQIFNGSGGSLNAYSGEFFINQNAYLNSDASNWIRNDAGYASQYHQVNGKHIWKYGASSTAGSAISFTQAMTLDASGNLGIGTTTPSSFDGSADNLVVGTTTGNNGITIAAGTSSASTLNFADGTAGGAQYTGYIDYQHSGNYMRFGTNGGTERMRIDDSGNLLVGKTNTTEANVGIVLNADGSTYFSRSGTTNSNSTAHVYSTGAAAFRFYVGMGGTVYATSTTITAISDQRLKENIRNLDDGLDVVMALKPRKFDWKEGKGQNIKNARGFIAQEFETVLPDMVETWRDPAPEGEEAYKAINANLIPTLVKAIQEQQAIIESLKARLDAANL